MTKIFVDKNLKIGTVKHELFGSFIEHLGRAVYEGIYEPNHKSSNKDGFREDVINLIKELNISTVRYPGGNFVSGYHFEDGIGPKEKRPVRLDMAWQTIEDNSFGTDEFMKWAKHAKVVPMMAVNLGTGTPLDAARLVEYCNFPKGTKLSDYRIKNGGIDPYNIKYWCLGNEMDGPWQISSLSAEDYAKKALITARMMKLVDPNIKLIAAGSSSPEMPTYPKWDRTILEELYEEIDYISMHRYYAHDSSLNDFYASYQDMDDFIKTIKSTINYVKTYKRSKKDVKISFDEYNIWYIKEAKLGNWQKAPHLIEDNYSMKDALVFSGLLNTLLNNVDVVEMASLAQLVNVIAPILTQKDGMAIRQTLFYPFKNAANNTVDGKVLKPIITGPKFNSKYGDVNYVSSSIINNEKEKEITVFLTNYHKNEMELDLEIRSFGKLTPIYHEILNSNDIENKNTFEKPNLVVPKESDLPTIKDNKVLLNLKPETYHMLKFKYEGI